LRGASPPVIRPWNTLVCSALLTTVLLAGCSAGETQKMVSPPAAPEESTAVTAGGDPLVVDCDAFIDLTDELPSEYESVLDAVALPTSHSATRALQASQQAGTQGEAYFAKTGLLVRPDVAVRIEVVDPSPTGLIGWGSTEFSRSLSISGCSGDKWMAFAGGFLVPEPQCVKLLVTTQNGRESVLVGVGAPCQGQEPPP